MNLAAPPPAKKQATASGLSDGDFGQQRLELHVREGQPQLLDDGAACFGVAVAETFESFVAGSVLPGDPDRLLVALVDHDFAQRQRGLRVGERGAKHVGSAQRAGGRVDAGVGDDVQHTAVARDFLDAHLHTRVHGADQHVDLVALHQPVRVFHTLRRFGFVVHLEPFDVAAAQLAAFFVDGHAQAVLDGNAKLREGAGVRQHQAHADLGGLGAHDLRQQQAGGCGAYDGGAAGQNESASGHMDLLI